MDPSEKKRPRKDDDDNNLPVDNGQLRCDCCSNFIISEDNHIQNTPCGHIICILCIVKSNMKRGAQPHFCQVRDCSQKFITSCQYFNRGMPGEIVENESAVQLGTDEIAWLLSFLPLKEIMPKRLVNKIWREAAKKTTVPPTAFRVNLQRYNAINVMTRALPNLQQINIGHLGYEQKYNEGEDPDERRAAATDNWTTHDIETISNFNINKLRILEIDTYAPLNGRYPFLFNSFPLIEKLSIEHKTFLKWDLEMLAGMPLLKELDCKDNPRLTGNISSLRVLKNTLEKVKIYNSSSVDGSFMDLADFPHLKELNLVGTAVTGDIRDVGKNDFLTLEQLFLPKGVFGGRGYELHRISDAPGVVRAVYLLIKQRPALKMGVKDLDWYCRLSEDSPDRYDSVLSHDTPPFDITFVKAGSRFGYRWCFRDFESHIPCAVNWLDAEPDRESSDYEEYIEELEEMNTFEVQFYRGFHQPPTEEEYRRLIDALAEESDSEESESDE